MRRFPGIALALFVVLAAQAPAEDPPPDGYELLFNGKDLAGWEGDTALWKVVDGAIVGDTGPDGIAQNEFLATRERFTNFELKLEFRMKDGRGNSGVQFRSRREAGTSAVIGYQADLGEEYWGCLYDEHRRNKILAQAPPELAKVLKKDDWNTYVIHAEGAKITLTLNGLQTVQYTESDDAIDRTGIIALQVHSGPALRMQFRNIRIKRLD